MKIVITGASGKLGGYLVEEAWRRGWEVQGWSHIASGVQVDLQNPAQVQRQLDAFAPEQVIHSAALSTVAECHRDAELAMRVNCQGSASLAAACERQGIGFLHVSTDMVFDGEAAPYSEESPLSPCTAYGRSKAAAEQAVVAAHPHALVVRVALLCGVSKTLRRSFFDNLLDQLKAGKTVRAFRDEWRSPLYLGDAAWALSELAHGQADGLVHLAGPQRLSRFQMCQRIAAALGGASQQVESMSRLEAGFDEPRQKDLSLVSLRVGALLPTFCPRPIEQAFAPAQV